MVVGESASDFFFEQSLLHQPVGGAGSRPGLTEGLPDREDVGLAWDVLPGSRGTLSRDVGTLRDGGWARTRLSECSEGFDMTTWTKRLLQGAGVSFLLLVLLGIFSSFAFGDREGAGPNAVWMVGTLLEVAIVAMLIGAGVVFLVGRVSRKASSDVP
jgi:hypothetical protein